MKDCYGREITYLRLSVTQLCNLRCRYCMPADGVCKKRHEEMMTMEEMITAVNAAATLGIRKLRITGGEPLMKKNIVSICREAASVPGIEELCLTTNGILLPGSAESLKQAGVQRINISLDTINEEKYSWITGGGKLSDALKGVEAALDAGFEKIKINTVLIGGFNDDEIPELAGLTMKYPVDVRFIELMPMYDGGDFDEKAYIPGSRVQEILPQLQPVPESDDQPGTARMLNLPGAKGKIGLINPISSDFCGRCSRIRITADGYVKPCLHSSLEFPVRGMNEEEMRCQIIAAIKEKPKRHGVLSEKERSRAGRNMNQIGG